MKVLICIEEFAGTGATQSLCWFVQWLVSCNISVEIFQVAASGEVPTWLPESVAVKGISKTISRKRLSDLFKSGQIRWYALRQWWRLLGQRLVVARWGSAPGWLMRLFACESTRYDVAISFNDDYCNRFVRTFHARKYVGWNHENYAVKYTDAGARVRQARYLNRLDAVWCVSETSRLALADALGVDRNRIHVMHNFIPFPNSLVERPVNPTPVEETSPYRIVSMGRMVAEKHFDLCVETAEMLARRKLDFVWEVYGDGSERPCLSEEIAHRGLKDCVRLLSWPLNPVAVLQKGHCYVQPSLNEGWGIMVTQAIMVGLPVAASDIPVFREQMKIFGRTDDSMRLCSDAASYAIAIESWMRSGVSSDSVRLSQKAELMWKELLEQERVDFLNALQSGL